MRKFQIDGTPMRRFRDGDMHHIDTDYAEPRLTADEVGTHMKLASDPTRPPTTPGGHWADRLGFHY